MPADQSQTEPAAARATGPRTAAGKRRSAQNARRHGLTAARLDEVEFETQFDRLRADPLLTGLDEGLITRLAEAELRVARVIAYQHSLLAQDPAKIAQEPHQLRCTWRYRAEAESASRKALREVIAALEVQRAAWGGPE